MSSIRRAIKVDFPDPGLPVIRIASAVLFFIAGFDGVAGVRKYAAPVLAEHGITGGISLCSRFNDRTEMFWRSKLSYLHSIDAGRHLRARLREYGYSRPELVREFTIHRFG